MGGAHRARRILFIRASPGRSIPPGCSLPSNGEALLPIARTWGGSSGPTRPGSEIRSTGTEYGVPGTGYRIRRQGCPFAACPFAVVRSAGLRITVNVVPCPSTLRTSIRPPISEINMRQRPSPRPVPPRVGAGGEEGLEDLFQVGPGDADAGVDHLDGHRAHLVFVAAAQGPGAERERAAVGHGGQGVGPEVEEHLLERVGIALDRRAVAQLLLDADVLLVAGAEDWSVASTAAPTSVLWRPMPCGRANAWTRLAVRSMRSRASTIICTYSVRCGSSLTRSPIRRRQFCRPSRGLAIWWAMPATS